MFSGIQYITKGTLRVTVMANGRVRRFTATETGAAVLTAAGRKGGCAIVPTAPREYAITGVAH